MENVEPDSGVATVSQLLVEALTKSVLEGERFMAFKNERGVVRAAVLDALVIGLADADVTIVRIRNSAPGSLSVGRLVALIVGGRYTTPTARLEESLERVVHVLTAQARRGTRLVLIVEDADTLEGPARAMLKLLPNLPREQSPNAQVLLVGRPGFRPLSDNSLKGHLGKAEVLFGSIRPAEPVEDLARRPGVDVGSWTTRSASPASGAYRQPGIFPLRSAGQLLALAGIAAAIASVSLVTFDVFQPSSPGRLAAVRPEALSGSLPAEQAGLARVAATAAVLSPEGGGVLGPLDKTPSSEPLPTVAAGQQTVSGASSRAPANAPADIEVAEPVPQTLDDFQIGSTKQLQPESVERRRTAKLRGRGGITEGATDGISNPRQQTKRSPESLVPDGLGYYQGSVVNETMHQGGQLSLVITRLATPGSIRARFDAGEGLLGSGELVGSLSDDGRISASGQLMMGKNPFICDLSGLIIGDKLTGSASFVRTSGGRTAHSSFLLSRS